MAMSRRRSAPVAKTNYDSDEDQIEYLNYNESKYYGYVDDFPSPVQVKRPNPKYKRPSEAVHIAVWDNDPALIQHLVLYKGHFVDAWNCLGQTPLFVAAYTRKLAMVNMLLNLGADPNVICVGGYTATHGACYSGSRRILNLILKFNGDLTIHDVHRSVPADWIEWQPDEKRRIRILDLLESVRKNTLRKSNSSASTASRRDKHLRSPKTSAASLPANEETGRALRLHHSRQHSHSLRNLSSTPNHHGSHVLTHDHKAVATNAASKIHPEQQQHHTFTRRLLAEQRRAKSHLECYDHEKSLSSDSDSSNGSSSRNSDVPNRRASACGLDCPDYVNGSTWYRHKSYAPPKVHSNANKRYFSNKKEDKSSKSVEYDLSVPRPSKRENLRHFTVMEPEKEAEKVPPRSTISRFREMYLADTIDAAASKKASTKTTQTSKFGCATLPTKLKQTSNFGSGRNFQSNSAPQMNGKSRGFEAKRQTSAPQISGNTLPDEVRQVYQKITSGQKVTKVKKDFKSAVSGQGQVSPNFQETKRVLHREAFKPASHFSEVRGYEKAVPKQICNRKENDGFDAPDTMTTSDYNFTEITENSQLEEPNMEKAEVFFNLRAGHDLPKKKPQVPQPNGQPMFASTPMGLYARRNMINIDGSYRAKKVRPFDPKVFEFDANGAIVTSSPLTTAAPVPIPPSLPTQTMVKNPKILPVTINSNSGKEVEFVSANVAQQQDNGAWASSATAQNSDAWVTANTGETWANNQTNAQNDGWANEQQNVAQDTWANTGQNAQNDGWANDQQNVGWPNQQAQDNGWANQQNDPNNGWANQQQAQNDDWANQQTAQNDDWANQQNAQNGDWANQQQTQNGDWANQQQAQNGDWANQQQAQNGEWANQNDGWANNDAQVPTPGAQSSATSWPNSGEENEFFSTNPVDVDQALEGNEEEPNSQNWITTEEYDEDNTEAPPRVSDLVQQKESEQELVTQQKQENEEEEVIQEVEETANEAPEEETVQEAFVSAAAGDSPISKDEPLTRSKLNVSFPESKRSPSRRLVNRKFQSLDLNLNMDGAASIDSSGYSGMHGPTNYWQNYQIMKHKASWLYGNNSWSRRTSDASSFISNAQEIEDLYCDDEISPNLETDPNMMLTAYLRENMGNNNPENINFPEKPCLTDRDSVLSMDIPSTGPSGPTSLRSEMGEDMEPIVEEK